MENPEKGHFNDPLRERTISLSIRVYNLFQDKKVTVLVRPIVNCDERQFWIEYLIRTVEVGKDFKEFG